MKKSKCFFGVQSSPCLWNVQSCLALGIESKVFVKENCHLRKNSNSMCIWFQICYAFDSEKLLHPPIGANLHRNTAPFWADEGKKRREALQGVCGTKLLGLVAIRWKWSSCTSPFLSDGSPDRNTRARWELLLTREGGALNNLSLRVSRIYLCIVSDITDLVLSE